jgi:hypothetical protein
VGVYDASSSLDLCNNILDGSGIGISSIATLTENYNDIGGAQGNSFFPCAWPRPHRRRTTSCSQAAHSSMRDSQA